MKQTMKRMIAIVLAAALCLSFAGCYSEENSWSARKGDETLTIGSYIYFLNSAYSLARAEVATDENVLKAELTDYLTDDVKLTGEQWVENRALNYVNSYFFLHEKFDELGLEFTEDEQTAMDSTTDSLWTYGKSSYEEMGVAKGSLDQCYSLYNNLYAKVMFAMYNEGGEMEISEDELKEFFEENFTSYEYFSVSLTTTDDEGNSVDMTDEEKEATMETINAYVEKINKGDMTMEEAAAEYAAEALGSEENTSYQGESVLYNDNMSDTFSNALADAEDNETVLAETTSGYFIIRKLPTMDKYEEYMSSDSNKTNIFGYMKGEDFETYLTEQAEHFEGVEINEKALKTVKLSKIVGDNKEGTSSAEESSAVEEDDEVESSAVESDTDSEVSSETEE